MVGLQECLVARRWGHRGFHTEELETHCRQLAWFKWGPGQWAGQLDWFVLDAAVRTDRGVVCSSRSSVNLDMDWGSTFTAGTSRQFYDCVCFVAPLGTDVDDHLLWVHVSYCSTVHCSNKQVFVWGSFLCFGFSSLWFSPLFATVEPGLMTGHLWTSGVRAVAFCLPVTLFPTTFACWVSSRAVVSTGRVLMAAFRAQCIWHQWLWIVCLAGVAYSMYCMTHTHGSCSWFHGVVCSTDL